MYLLDTDHLSVLKRGGAQAEVLRPRLQQQRIRIGTMDLKIAGITLAHGATLLSRNVTDFQKVPGLLVEDWTT